MTPTHDLTGAVSRGCLAPCAYGAAGRWHRPGRGCPQRGLPPMDRRPVREGVTSTVGGAIVRRGLSRADVEALACQIYPWRDHLDDLAP
jgi:hypothetical protein